jgi:hypothetical protein
MSDMLQHDPQVTMVAANPPDASIETRPPTSQADAEPPRRSSRRRPWRARVGARLRRFMEVGPVRAGRVLLPYGVGVRLQRALVAQPAMRRHYAKELGLLRQWAEAIGANTPSEELYTISLLANTWRIWRAKALAQPGVLGTWVQVRDPGRHLLGPADGKAGTIIALPHVGTLVSPLCWLCAQYGRETAAVTNTRMGGVLGTAEREKRQLAARTEMLWHAQEVLRRGGIVFIPADNMQRVRSIDMPFWGRRRPFRLGTAELALTTGAALVPTYPRFDAHGRLWIEVTAPLSAPPAAPEDQMIALTRHYAADFAARWPQFFASANWAELDITLRLPSM